VKWITDAQFVEGLFGLRCVPYVLPTVKESWSSEEDGEIPEVDTQVPVESNGMVELQTKWQ